MAERESEARERILVVRERIGLINTDVDRMSAQKDGPDLQWACKELREIADSLDVPPQTPLQRLFEGERP